MTAFCTEHAREPNGASCATCGLPQSVNCPACDGSGWTLEGWANASRPENRESFDWRVGDCKACAGTGAVAPVVIRVTVLP